METQKTPNSQNNLGKEQCWRNQAPWLQTILQSYIVGFPGGTVVKNPPANAEDMGSITGPGRSHMPHSN